MQLTIEYFNNKALTCLHFLRNTPRKGESENIR